MPYRVYIPNRQAVNVMLTMTDMLVDHALEESTSALNKISSSEDVVPNATKLAETVEWLVGVYRIRSTLSEYVHIPQHPTGITLSGIDVKVFAAYVENALDFSRDMVLDASVYDDTPPGLGLRRSTDQIGDLINALHGLGSLQGQLLLQNRHMGL